MFFAVSFPAGSKPCKRPRRFDRRHDRPRRRAVGNDLRLDAADFPAPARARSRDIERALRRHTRRCHGADYLFHRRDADPARDGAVGYLVNFTPTRKASTEWRGSDPASLVQNASACIHAL